MLSPGLPPCGSFCPLTPAAAPSKAPQAAAPGWSLGRFCLWVQFQAFSRHGDAWAVPSTLRLQQLPLRAAPHLICISTPFLCTEPIVHLTLDRGCPQGSRTLVHPNTLSISAHKSPAAPPQCWSCLPDLLPPNAGGHLRAAPSCFQLRVLAHDF